MNNVISIINAVRENCDVSWLTASQQGVYDRLRSGFEHQRVLNVFGESGVGKTMLAWVLEREGYGQYWPGVADLPAGHRRVLIDNFAESQKARRLIDRMDDLRIGQVVLFTQLRINDDFPAFELRLSSEDVAYCKATLFQQLNVHFYSETSYDNLHDLLRSLS